MSGPLRYLACLAIGLYAGTSWACVAPSPSALDSVASRIVLRVAELESRLPESERKTRPSILMRVVDDFNPTTVSADMPQSFRNSLASSLCIDKVRLGRQIVSAVQARTSSIAFIGELGNAELQAIAARINAIGVGNIDPETVTRLRAFDVNYVVVVGGNADISKSGCGFNSTFAADLDIHSLTTTEVIRETAVNARVYPAVTSLRRSMQASIGPPDASARLGSLTLQASQPVCLGRTVVDFSDSSGDGMNASWTFNAGCLLGGESRTYTPKDGEVTVHGWPQTGAVLIRPDRSTCGSISIDDSPIRSVFAPGWQPAQTTTVNNGGQYRPGAPPGTVLIGCGCWGTAPLNVPFPNAQCSSGYAVFQGCPAGCPWGGQSYGTVCR